MVKQIQSESEFNKIVGENKLTVVDWFATWCGPCQQIAPVLEDLASKYRNVNFIKVDVDQQQELAGEHGIRAMPTFHFWKAGKKVDELQGADARALVGLIEKHQVMPSVGKKLGSGGGTAVSQPQARPAQVPSAPAAPAVDAALVAQLTSLGISEGVARQALVIADGNFDMALELALDGSISAEEVPPPAPVAAPAAPAASVPAPVPAPGPGGTCELQIRLPEGGSKRNTFNAHQTLHDVVQFLRTQGVSGVSSFATAAPPRTFAGADLNLTLEAAGLCPRSMIIAKKP